VFRCSAAMPTEGGTEVPPEKKARADEAAPGSHLISWADAVELLRGGGALAYPTDTVWGIGCRADDVDVVKACVARKGEKRSPICSILVPGKDRIGEYVAFDLLPEEARACVLSCLPGCYTFALPLPAGSPFQHIAGPGSGEATHSLGVRLVDDANLMRAVEELGAPLLTTSLNITGEPPARSLREAAAVAARMGIRCIDVEFGQGSYDGAATREEVGGAEAGPGGQASTVLAWDLGEGKWRVIRQGAGEITEHIRRCGIVGQ